MLKVNELRISNLIKRRSVDDILVVDLKILESIQRQGFLFVGIPLTEEWLLKFGFDREVGESESGILTYQKYFNNEHLGIWYYPDKVYDFQINVDKFFKTLTKLKYVHQLQNLYFALTGEELTYNSAIM